MTTRNDNAAREARFGASERAPAVATPSAVGATATASAAIHRRLFRNDCTYDTIATSSATFVHKCVKSPSPRPVG